MKKIYCILLFMSIGSICIGQSIKRNEVDKFTKKKVIETSFEKICTGNPLGGIFKNVWLSFVQNGDATFIRLKWNSHEIVGVSEGAKVLFLDSDGETYNFTNTISAVASKGAGTIGFVGSVDYGVDLYLKGEGDVDFFTEKNITDMRIHTTDGYVDFKLLDAANKRLEKLYKLFDKARD